MSATIVRLTLLATCCGLLISGVHALTREHIRQNRETFETRQLLDVAGDPEAVITKLDDDLYTIEKNGARTGYIFEANTNQGYNGKISLWIAVSAANEILGVRVKSHQETPGIGDKLETRVSDWIHSFDGKSLSNPAPDDWQVKKDGGKFDQFTGATITPRAVVDAVRRGLQHAGQRQPTWQQRGPSS